jgi:hypothetical protein
MLKRALSTGLFAGAAWLVCAQAAHAQQTLNFTLGYFTPLGADARVEGDVLNANSTFLTFEVDDFNGASIGGEWLVPFNNFIEGGIGISFSRKSVESVYRDYVDDLGGEIFQETKLRMLPIAFTIRVVPTGQRSVVQPYFGAGLGIINWRYSETGEFIDFGAGGEIFHDSFVADGSETGPVILGGIRFAGRSASGGFEIRYQKADADLDPRFTAPRLDLGGWTYNGTFGFRF